MKVALCISGHLRGYNYAFPDIKKYILDVYNPDKCELMQTKNRF